ncbi:MAG: F0F1 ATP synthase subunit epsilon [Pseudomonadota bacterium]
MADLMQFDLVSPERRLASVEAKAVQIPGTDGDLTAMPDHAPLVMTLRPGILTVEPGSGDPAAYLVTGGFADISGPATTVLAEQAMPTSEVTQEILDGLIADAKAAAERAPDGDAAAAKIVADFEAIRGALKG